MFESGSLQFVSSINKPPLPMDFDDVDYLNKE